MCERFLAALVAVLIANVLGGSVSGAAELNAPMSSTKKDPATVAPSRDGAPADPATALDVEKLFAGTCGWCHSNAGRTAGKGPQLMGTTLTDAEIIHRIKVGKPGAMPAFGSAFTDDQMQAIVKYIRGLRDEGPAK
jgi:mono/diheme cytochrome c family protein